MIKEHECVHDSYITVFAFWSDRSRVLGTDFEAGPNLVTLPRQATKSGMSNRFAGELNS